MPHDTPPAAPSLPAPPQFAAGPQQATLLLTDLVGSTQLTRQLGDAAAASLWRQHDQLSLQLLRTWGGRKIDQSDGLLLLFPRPAAALGFALAYHRALATLQPPLQARVGIHHSAVDLRVASPEDIAYGAKPLEVDGLAKPVAGRIMALAQGGQTLLSEATGQALAATATTAPATWRLRPQGHWRFKGLDEPIALLEALPADDPAASDTPAPFTPPPPTGHDKAYRVVWRDGLWHPVDEQRHNLPAERDRFIGRDGPLAELARHVDDGHRLVSVLGPGGTGKTRLALRHARAWRGEFPGGAWWCDLTAARSLDGLLHAVAQGLELPLGKGAPVPQIGQALASRGRALVVLDNFEQVVAHAEATLGAWLEQAPETCFLVTSRERLQVRGEQCLWLEPMPRDEAAALLRTRASAIAGNMHEWVTHGPQVDIGSSDETPWESIAGALDGLPLALELAAHRLSVTGLGAFLSFVTRELHDPRPPLHALGPDRRDVLKSSFGWTWSPLPLPEKVLLAQLSVFASTFDLPAALAVALPDVASTGNALDPLAAIEALRDRCLIQQTEPARWRLLPTIRELVLEEAAREGLDLRPDVVSRHSRHASYFASVDEVALNQRADADGQDVIAACIHLTAQTPLSEIAVRALRNAWLVLQRRGPLRVAIQLADALLARLPEAALGPVDRFWIHWVQGSATLINGQVQSAKAHFEVALSLGKVAGQTGLQSRALSKLSDISGLEQNHVLASEQAMAAITAARQSAEAEALCLALNNAGTLAWSQDRPAEALPHFAEGLEVAQGAQLARWTAGFIGNMATMHHVLGKVDRAMPLYRQAAEQAQACNEYRWAANAYCNLGLLRLEQGELDDADQNLQRALKAAVAIGDNTLRANILCNLGLLTSKKGDRAMGITQIEAAIGIAQGLSDQRLVDVFREELDRLASLNPC